MIKEMVETPQARHSGPKQVSWPKKMSISEIP